MKEQTQKFTSNQLKDASFKFILYLRKITGQQYEQANLQKLSNLAIDYFLKFVDSEQFIKSNFVILKTLIYDKKSFYVLYIVDSLLKNNKLFMGLAKKDLEGMFKVVWQKAYYQPKNQYKIDSLKSMVKTWGVIFQKNFRIEETLNKWLQQKFQTNLNLTGKSKILFEQQYEKMKNENDSKLSALLTQITKEEPRKVTMNSFLQLKQKIFED